MLRLSIVISFLLISSVSWGGVEEIKNSITRFFNQNLILFSSQDILSAEDPKGLWLFLGAKPGLLIVSRQKENLSKQGHQMNFNVSGSYYSIKQPWIFDAALGFSNHQIGDKNLRKSIPSLTFEARHIFTKQWSIGPSWSSFFNGSQFFGVTADYEIALKEKWLFRMGGKILTDISSDKERLNKFLVNIQLGFPSGKSFANF